MAATSISAADEFGAVVGGSAGQSVKGKGKGGGAAGLAAEMAELEAAAAQVRGGLVAPGQMSKDEAGRYFARVANLFPGVERLTVDLAVFAWGALHGTGSKTNYTEADPIEVGGVKVPATEVFGGIIPVDARGLPRKAFSTYFEEKAVKYLAVLPELGPKLSARAAKSGNAGAPPITLIDFVKGVSASTSGGSASRQHAKDTFLRRRGVGAGVEAGAPAVDLGGPAPSGGGSTSTGGLF